MLPMAPTATEEPQPKRARRISVARVVVIILLLVAGVFIIFRPSGSDLPKIVLLPLTTTIKYDPFPDRLIPRSWGWAWRLRDSIVGKRTPVNFDAQMLRLTNAALLADLRQLLPQATLVTNGLSMWSLDDAHLESARASLGGTNQSNPNAVRARMNTADGIVASMFSGHNIIVAGKRTEVGFRPQVLPRTHKTRPTSP